MTFREKFNIVSVAQKLIYLLEECDDGEFVDEILNCVMSADTLSLEELKEGVGCDR